MENESSQARAREALESVQATRAQVAERLITPWWYHPILAVLVAQMVLVTGVVQSTAWKIVSAVLMVAGAAALITVYTKITGMTLTRPAGARSARWFWASVLVIAAPVLRVSVASLGAGQAVGWALVALIGIVVLGRRYDLAYREDLRTGGTR